ncbi:MAG: PQQ-binding-like beta-propeller repeat protein [Planctomycetes bacterium]|nr:PQQ-binding-like beta-propeller repeat protein [Planctomycetota bacterium]
MRIKAPLRGVLEAILLASLLIPRHICAQAQPEEQSARRILGAAGVKGGLIVHLGCSDGRLTAALHASDSYLVQGLDTHPANVEKARAHIRSLGLYGKVSVALWQGDRLPYADNLVNLIVGSGKWEVERKEIMRVLAPGGVALLLNRKFKIENPKWVKPWPKDIDEWTHFLHGPDNNAVAKDSVIGPPGRIQWTAGPLWSRDHDVTPSIFGPVSAKGRLFYIEDEGPICVIDKRLPEKHSLVARDALNGVLLWKRPMRDWYSSRVIWGHIPAHTERRLVAVGDRVYATLGVQAPVTALDAATGRTIREVAGTANTSEIVCDRGILALVIRKEEPAGGLLAGRERKRFRKGYKGPVGGGQAVMAVDADTGKRLWRQERAAMPLTLALSGGRVFFVEEGQVVCLDAATGKELWRTPFAARTLLVHGDRVVTSTDRKTTAYSRAPKTIEVVALSVTDGKRLWSASGDCLPNFNFFYVPVDLYVAQGQVWGLAENLEWNKKPGSGNLLGLDLATGQVKTRIPLSGAFTPGHHVRCYKGKATDRFLLFNKRGIEFVGIGPKEGTIIQTRWVRGACRYGILPCNGLIYAPSHACACYPGALLRGFYALAPEDRESKARSRESKQLEKGPAFADIPHSTLRTPHSEDWPTYRHDPARSGFAKANVPASLQRTWQVDVGGRLTAPVVAGGKVLVASTDTHTVYALDAQTGKPIWEYTAGARVDSPPTVHKGMVLFGCRDGWVYCLRAADGALVWRFRGAPMERRVGAYGQLESAWPIHGSVLVKDDVVYFAAGRSSFLDNGIYVYGLDVSTGKQIYGTHLSGPDPRRTKFEATAGRMPGAVPDILTSDGANLYLRHVQLDPQLSVQPDAKGMTWGIKSKSHLLVGSGFLDDTLFNRTVWQYGRYVNRSQLLVFDNEAVYGVRVYSGISWNAPIYEVGEGNLLFSTLLHETPQERKARLAKNPPPKRPKILFRIPYETFRWHQRVPMRIQAMVLSSGAGAAKTLFIAGPPDVLDPKDPLAAFEGRKGGLLWTVSAADGKKLGETKLDSPPVFDGMAAAEGRLYISTRAGRLICIGEK